MARSMQLGCTGQSPPAFLVLCTCDPVEQLVCLEREPSCKSTAAISSCQISVANPGLQMEGHCTDLGDAPFMGIVSLMTHVRQTHNICRMSDKDVQISA